MLIMLRLLLRKPIDVKPGDRVLYFDGLYGLQSCYVGLVCGPYCQLERSGYTQWFHRRRVIAIIP